MLDDIKLFLGITDNVQDTLLNLIINDSEQRIVATLNSFAGQNGTDQVKEVPDQFVFIHRDVSIKRFNKINSEGATSDSEEGRSLTWESSYLDEYGYLFDQYTKPTKTAGQGIARFV